MPHRIKEVLISISEQAGQKSGMQQTPERVFKAWRELTEGERLSEEEIRDLIKVFPIQDEVGKYGNYDQIVAFFNIPFASTCEHHLMPFHGVAHIGYLPGDYLIGASKPARLLDVIAQRFQIQERITVQLANLLYGPPLKPRGVIVVLEAVHTCMTCRGVRKPGASMVTSAVRGDFYEPALKEEFFQLLRLNRSL